MEDREKYVRNRSNEPCPIFFTDLPKFTFTRTGDTSQALTVKYTLAGKATPAGVSAEQADYSSPVAGQGYTGEYSVTIPAGQAGVSVDLTAPDDDLVEGTENVSLSLMASKDYRLDGRIDHRNAGASIVDTTPWADLAVAGLAEDKGGALPPNEVVPGLALLPNVDDDNADGIPDCEDAPPETPYFVDDDLLPVSLNYRAKAGAQVTLSVSGGTGKIKVWADNRKETLLLNAWAGLTSITWTVGVDVIPSQVYLEGVYPSSQPADSELDLKVVDGSRQGFDFITTRVVSAKEFALSLLDQEEAKHKGKLYYGPSGIPGLFTQLRTVVNEITIGFGDPGADNKALYNPTYDVLTLRTNSSAADVIHELIHALDDKRDWYITTWGTYNKAEALAYGAEALLENAAGLAALEEKATAQNAQVYWDIAWRLYLQNGTIRSQITWKDLTGKHSRPMTSADVLDIKAKLGLTFSASALLPLYNQMLAAKGLPPNSLNNNFAFTLDPAFR